ncbi:MAG: penicillin acylase family protein [Chloroflexota bacterium]
MATIVGKTLRMVFGWLDRGNKPVVEGEFTVGGLQEKVEILRDRWGIAHIYARNEHDLFFAEGFVHAQERLFQMELNRRTAQGTLSEVFGELALETDRAVRTFGFNRLGRVDWVNAAEEMRDVILAYCEGVNAYLQWIGKRLPVEFKLLGFQPQPWTPEDTTAFARVMMWQLSHAWHSEIVRLQIQEKVGAEHLDELEIHYPAQSPISLPKGIEFNRLSGEGKLVSAEGPFLKRGQGSNSWVVGREKSEDGHTYLFNDMHLALSMPGLWYQVHLNGGRYHVSGVSLPGAPGVLVGHNERIAWGMTLAFIDCEDLYLEQMDPLDDSKYLFRGEWVQAEVIPEVIPIKGKDKPHVEKVLVTRHGPIISDVVGTPNVRLAVRSMALRPSPSLNAWLALDRAKDWDEFVLAMRGIEAPQLSVCYADVEGNIGYWMTGRAPIRAQGDGRIPVPGWHGEYEWVGEVPFEQMPHALNPEQGFIVHTNNKIVGDDYPYYLGNVWMNGSRARRIEQVLRAKEKVSREEMCRLHTDTITLPGKELAEKLQQMAVENSKAQKAQELMKDWNGDLAVNSVAGCIYEVVRLALARNLLEPALGQDLTEQYLGKAFSPVLMTLHEFFGHDITLILRMLENGESWWVQQAGGLRAWVEKSLAQAVEWLERELGTDSSKWQWGRIHGAVFPHPLGLQKPLDQAFNRGPYPIGGDADTPCQTAYQPHQPYHNNAWSPSFRQVVDLDDLSRSVTIAPPGQSGHIGSEHYDDLIEPWLRGEYHPQLWKREQVEKEMRGKLVLK